MDYRIVPSIISEFSSSHLPTVTELLGPPGFHRKVSQRAQQTTWHVTSNLHHK